MSAPEPGPSETMNLTGFCGHDCAAALNETASESAAAAMLMSVFNCVSSCRYTRPLLYLRRDDCNTQSWNAGLGKDGRADGGPSHRQGLCRRRLRSGGRCT